MMKAKDFICLFVGIALLALAFLFKGSSEETTLNAVKYGSILVGIFQIGRTL